MPIHHTNGQTLTFASELRALRQCVPNGSIDPKVDVHTLRHTAGTQLAKAGVLPQVASRIMRHSTIDMTMKHDTHLALEDKSKAVERLPIYEGGFGVEEARKTGTDCLDGGVDHCGDQLPEKGEVVALCEEDGENPEIAVLVDLLITFICQERTQIISELSKEQRYAIVHMAVRRLMEAKADGA